MSLANFLFFACTIRIASRSSALGKSICTILSNLPGRLNAVSRDSIKFVAAINITPSRGVKPSNETSNWFTNVFWHDCTFSFREVAIESISSKKIIQGEISFA